MIWAKKVSLYRMGCMVIVISNILGANPMLAPLLVHLGEYPGPGGGRVRNKFLYREAPSRGPTPCPFIYHFS